MNTPRIIDIFLSVIDNYGDMGFAVELLSGFKQRFRDVYDFCIWTDSPSKTEDFFQLHTEYLPKYSILPR